VSKLQRSLKDRAGVEAAMQRFRIDIPQPALDDLNRRLDMTRWTDDFANEDWRYGANARVRPDAGRPLAPSI
jgi:hypothetical protein